MRGIRRWLTTAALVAGTSAAAGQAPLAVPASESSGLLGGTPVGGARTPAGPILASAPAPTTEPAISAALPAGTVVGSARAPVANVTILNPAQNVTVAPAPPAAGASIVVPPRASPMPGGPVVVGPAVVPAPVPAGPPIAGCGLPNPAGDCCGPIGADGPIGQEVYLRFGANFPIGNNLLPKGLNTGYTVQVGGRSQFFDPSGTSAWAVDVHLHWSYNNADSQDVVTVRGEPVFVRELHRWAVGLGFGRDTFLTAPGFVGGTWDANFRLGWDVGGRWGTGHVDLNPLFEPDGYRRRQDVFAQTFLGVMGTMEVPMGGWTGVAGVRLEWDYTFADFIPKGSSFHEVNALLMCGVRY